MSTIFSSLFTSDDIYAGREDAARIGRTLYSACAAHSYLAIYGLNHPNQAIDAITIRLLFVKTNLYQGDLAAVVQFANHVVSAFESTFPVNRKDAGVDLLEMASSIWFFAFEADRLPEVIDIVERIRQLIERETPQYTGLWQKRFSGMDSTNSSGPT
jgi:hypothetical protein